MAGKVLKAYEIKLDKLNIPVNVIDAGGFVKEYQILAPKITEATHAFLETVKDDLLRDAKIGLEEIFEPARIKKLIEEFKLKTKTMIQKRLPTIPEKTKNFLTQ